MQVGDVLQPITKAVTTSLTVATACARHMVDCGSGVILVMAAELGPHGVRVAWLLSPGSPKPDEPDPDAAGLLLPRRPSYADVANAAVFAAATMTATELNLTGGLVVD